MIDLAGCFEEKGKKKIDEHASAYQNPFKPTSQQTPHGLGAHENCTGLEKVCPNCQLAGTMLLKTRVWPSVVVTLNERD